MGGEKKCFYHEEEGRLIVKRKVEVNQVPIIYLKGERKVSPLIGMNRFPKVGSGSLAGPGLIPANYVPLMRICAFRLLASSARLIYERDGTLCCETTS